jgi:outer membrane protein assembly factor BamB
MKTKAVFLLCILLLVTTVIPTSESIISKTKENKDYNLNIADGWPMFRHDLAHTGYSASSAPNTNTTLWSYSLNEDYIWFGDSSPAVLDGKVYIGACTDIIFPNTVGYVYCLDEFSGEFIWSLKTDGWVASSPTISENRVYVGSISYFHTPDLLLNGTVYCLDSEDGGIIWNYQTIYKVYSSLAVSNGKVYFGSTDLDTYNSKGEIVCLDSNNGTLIWKYTPDKGIWSSPAISNDRLYVGCMDGKVYCLNAENGSIMWSFNTGGRIISSPTIFENKVYIGSLNGKIYCLNAENGDEFWNYTAEGDVGGSPAVGYGNVYIGTHYSQSIIKLVFIV